MRHTYEVTMECNGKTRIVFVTALGPYAAETTAERTYPRWSLVQAKPIIDRMAA
jgi:hypothetical protein